MLGKFNKVMQGLHAESQVKVLRFLYDNRRKLVARKDIAKELNLDIRTVNKAVENLSKNHGVEFEMNRRVGIRIVEINLKARRTTAEARECDLWALAHGRIKKLSKPQKKIEIEKPPKDLWSLALGR